VLAFIILSLVLWFFLGYKKILLPLKKINNYYPLIFLFLLFFQILMGAFVSGMDAGKIYNSWPLMGSTYFPDDNEFSSLFNLTAFDEPSLVQFIHRNLAYLILIFYLIILFKIYSNKMTEYVKIITIIGFFLFLQVVLGVLTLLSGAQIFLSSIHQISSIFLISSSIYFLFLNTKTN
jgi:cytochrome c oxidase assembly protein subunit 15